MWMKSEESVELQAIGCKTMDIGRFLVVFSLNSGAIRLKSI